ncbi:PLG [Mytilus edulis]|uniref:PLG n=1 Tax=Mytilus edulis TaxID=6550 RepID=A0A8S3SAX2_MYTED|nr:PLG [Mytilus edulis]
MDTSLFLLTTLFFIEIIAILPATSDDCYYRIDGKAFYNGTRSITASGITCQRWDSNSPHIPKQWPSGRGNKNYCRNPDEDDRPWCYTSDPETRWEYCGIDLCELTTIRTSTPKSVATEDDEDDDTPVAVILGVLFGVRGVFNAEPSSADQRISYIYSAPEQNHTLLARVRKIIRWNRKNDGETNIIATNPGYSAMDGERIEPIDYANMPMVKPRVYEMPSASESRDHQKQLYTSLYDTPNGGNKNQESASNELYENEYEIAERFVQPPKPKAAIKPILKGPKPSPKPSPKIIKSENVAIDNKPVRKPLPKPIKKDTESTNIMQSHNPVQMTDSQDKSGHIEVLNKPVSSQDGCDYEAIGLDTQENPLYATQIGSAQINESPNDDNKNISQENDKGQSSVTCNQSSSSDSQSPETIKQSNSVLSLVQKFNKT